jgi:hypothetical protein
MRHTLSQYSNKLCHNCLLREEKRNPKKEENMQDESDTVQILLKFPREIQIEIEEFCIENGIDFSQYFLKLYSLRKSEIKETKEQEEKTCPVKHNQIDDEAMKALEKTEKTRGKKK